MEPDLSQWCLNKKGKWHKIKNTEERIFFFFTVQVVKQSNGLLEDVVKSSSLEIFKTELTTSPVRVSAYWEFMFYHSARKLGRIAAMSARKGREKPARSQSTRSGYP